MSLEFKIFTLNCWAIAVVSKNRRSRIKAISEYLSNSQYDVVCLQEVWTDRDYYMIKDEVAGVLPYSHYFYRLPLKLYSYEFFKNQLLMEALKEKDHRQ